MNTYRYVVNQPLKRKDRQGLSWIKFCAKVLKGLIAGIAAGVGANAIYDFCTQCEESPDCDNNPPQPTPLIPEDKSKYCMYHGVPYEPGEGMLRPSVERGCERVCVRTGWCPCSDPNGTSFFEAYYVCKNTAWFGTEYNWKFVKNGWGAKVRECNACVCGQMCEDRGFTYDETPVYS